MMVKTSAGLMFTLQIFGHALMAGILSSFGAPIQANAQDDPSRPALPDIAPRVVEIRGQLEISLPSLQRQPLIGFNPPPRVAPIPPERRPFIEDYKDRTVELPPSALRPPQPPEVASLVSRPPRSGVVEAGAGRYLSRIVRARTEWGVSEGSAFVSRLDYRGTDGHRPFTNLPDVRSAGDALEAKVGFRSTSRMLTGGVDLQGFLNRYDLFAAEAGSNGALRSESPERDGRGGGIEGWLRTQAASRFDLETRLRYAAARFETDALVEDFSGSNPFAAFSLDGDPFEAEEQTLVTEADLSIPLSRGASFVADGRISATGLEGQSIGKSVRTFGGAAGIRLAARRGIDVTVGARLLSFASERQRPGAGDNGIADGTYVVPQIALNLYPGTGLRLYAWNRPSAEHHTLSSLYRMNPYLVDEPIVQPSIVTTDARGGAHWLSGAFELDLHAGFRRAPNYLFFERADEFEARGFARGMTTANYGDAEILYAGGDVSVNLPSGFNASAGMTVRRGELTDGEDIPYFGPIVGRGAVSYSFAAGKGFAQATGRYESARYVNRDQSRRIGDYFDLDVEVSYDFTSSLGALLRLENLSAGYLERWENYEEAPFVVMVGLRLLW